MFYDRKIKLAILIDDAMYRRTIHPDDLERLGEFAEIINPPPYPAAITPE